MWFLCKWMMMCPFVLQECRLLRFISVSWTISWRVQPPKRPYAAYYHLRIYYNIPHCFILFVSRVPKMTKTNCASWFGSAILIIFNYYALPIFLFIRNNTLLYYGALYPLGGSRRRLHTRRKTDTNPFFSVLFSPSFFSFMMKSVILWRGKTIKIQIRIRETDRK